MRCLNPACDSLSADELNVSVNVSETEPGYEKIYSGYTNFGESGTSEIIGTICGDCGVEVYLPDALSVALAYIRRVCPGMPPDIHRVDVVHDRDPDGSCDITVYLDGAPVECNEHSIDPGAGHSRAEWDEATAADVEEAKSRGLQRLAEDIEERRAGAADSPYITES